MATNKLEALEGQVFSLLKIIEPHIQDDFKEQVIEFITHCEIGLAYEDIVSTLLFLNIKITSEQFEKFKIEEVLNHVDKDILLKVKNQVV